MLPRILNKNIICDKIFFGYLSIAIATSVGRNPKKVKIKRLVEIKEKAKDVKSSKIINIIDL
jgi:hypothetical protein